MPSHRVVPNPPKTVNRSIENTSITWNVISSVMGLTLWMRYLRVEYKKRLDVAEEAEPETSFLRWIAAILSPEKRPEANGEEK